MQRFLNACCCRAATGSERLLTHNVLSASLAERAIFHEIDPMFLDRGHRFRCFVDEIKRHAPSVVLLQESSIVDFPILESTMLELGFCGVQQRRTTPVPLATFWKKSRWKLLWTEERSRVQICQLLHRASSATIYTLNCHLQGSPDEKTSLTRVSQLHNALRRLELRLQLTNQSPQDAKIFVCGDFNSKAEDAPVRFLRQNRLEASLEATTHQHVDEHGHPTEEITHPFSFVEAYEAFDLVPDFSHVRNGVGTRVDFIWSQGVELEGVLNVLEDVLLGDTWETVRVSGWPNANQCSDHCPLACDFRI